MLNFKGIPVKNHEIFISFHISWSHSGNRVVALIDSIMKNHFGELTERISKNDQQIYELVYRVQRPILSDEESSEKFFKNLKEIFALTEDYSPHFTHNLSMESNNR